MSENLPKYGDSVLGCRYELKYRISESKAEAITQFIKPYLHLDRYSKLRTNGAYPIVSLYLDSDNLQLCRESLEGKKNRLKLRIRSYTDEPDYPRFFEIKQHRPHFFEIKRRVNNIIIKSRARVKYQDVSSLLLGASLPLQTHDGDGETLKQFQLYANSINAGPVILIRYMRQAYEDDSENRVRVTFDRELFYNVTRELKVTMGGAGWQRLFSNDVILEIKFTGRYPAWLSQMVKVLNLHQQSNSKYARSVKQACKLGFCAPRLTE